jgi:Membrane bound beta barrel domain (DUF5777)
MKKIVTQIAALLLFISVPLFAQDDLLKELEAKQAPEINYATHTFKITRVVNGQSIEGIAKKHLDFRINHRFGKLNEGEYTLYGLDNATIRLSLEYGITDNIMVGVGRSNTQKYYDGFTKIKLLRQSSGAKVMPVSVSLFANTAITTIDGAQLVSGYKYKLSDRMSYCGQLLIARKFSERLSLQLSPTWVHRNLVPTKADINDIFALGIGGRIKLTNRTTFNAEYFYQLPGKDGNDKYVDPTSLGTNNSLSVGFDIETGGHVFQLHITNSVGNIEQLFITNTTDSWKNNGLHFGFNISRTFSFAKE